MDADRSIVTLCTDFGTADYWVAAMKGVILAINPRAFVVDLTHEIAPQDIEEAAFVAGPAWAEFPPGCIHVCVVDPGVGTRRAGLVVQTGRALFVGPDNGVLSAALPEEARPAGGRARRLPLPLGCRAFHLTNESLFRRPVSDTFHGRDIFAPVAAHLSCGLSPREVGEPAGRMLLLPRWSAEEKADGTLAGRVVHVDRYGNLWTTVRVEQLPAGPFVVGIAGQQAPGPYPSFEAGPELKALVGSTGHLEIALRRGSAAARLGAGRGTPVVVQSAKQRQPRDAGTRGRGAGG